MRLTFAKFYAIEREAKEGELDFACRHAVRQEKSIRPACQSPRAFLKWWYSCKRLRLHRRDFLAVNFVCGTVARASEYHRGVEFSLGGAWSGCSPAAVRFRRHRKLSASLGQGFNVAAVGELAVLLESSSLDHDLGIL